MNNVQLIGRLTKDIELRYTQSGLAKANFTLAVNRSVKNQNGEREADFIQCQAWRKIAEVLAKYTSKGSQIGVVGRIQTHNYENQQGQRVYVTQVVVSEIHFLDNAKSKSRGENSVGNINYQPTANTSNNGYFSDFEGGSIDIQEDDLPF
ncbi:single-stranded DNA-binding protein [Aerococcaceae bacterium zg-ZUI334]|uniref:single-stranded DNA-binding protein n=1 Tax=Aerococcaceae bacterium zg-252 TaxID=2796928 RepID=UPI001B9B9C28|nr:single-stranded DNA-binding protein [Aerococcaceae bacterium zg-ZUI334]